MTTDHWSILSSSRIVTAIVMLLQHCMMWGYWHCRVDEFFASRKLWHGDVITAQCDGGWHYQSSLRLLFLPPPLNRYAVTWFIYVVTVNNKIIIWEGIPVHYILWSFRVFNSRSANVKTDHSYDIANIVSIICTVYTIYWYIFIIEYCAVSVLITWHWDNGAKFVSCAVLLSAV